MKKSSVLIGTVVAGVVITVLGFAVFAMSQRAEAEDGLVRSTWPSPEDPGMPFYARVELMPPYIFNDGEWAAIIFYRDPGCVPADFNLISVFNPPAAFSCPHTVNGFSLYHEAIFNGAPKSSSIYGNGAVPVWFVPWQAVEDRAVPGGVLTMTDLMQIQDRLVGYAANYVEELQPHPAPAFGGGGHPNPKMIVNAQGQLEDGRSFFLHIAWVNDVVQSIQIQIG